MRAIIIIALLSIVAVLALAGGALLKGGRAQESRDDRMFKTLALRVALSVALFLFILLSYKLGWIKPTGVPI